ncbi:sialidase family protein [Parapedobacter sp. 10938]|uniref:sialidase family protein n=1 Tax=Parapedobacter flavus TaxID=3110225 RepID=UPI002DBA0E46|nr:sialidase family protein [Parapedobacter sp. 10938]MEC3878983.1 sialidase family protein [Parapedobacter sp. 10938]
MKILIEGINWVAQKLARLGMFCAMLVLLFAGCYKEQHFGFPGPFDEEQRMPDSLPFPFDENREAGHWLMRAGVPDHSGILFKGYTDFYAAGDTTSWVPEPEGMRLIPHRNYYPITNDDHFGGNPNSYRFNWAMSKYFVPIGPGKSFYMYTRLTVGTFSGTAMGLMLGVNWETGQNFVFGMDGFSAIAPMFFVDLYGTTASVDPNQGWPTVNEVIVPGVPADVEVVVHDGLFYVLINGTLCFQFKLPGETFYFTPKIRPHRNFITVHDLYIESPDAFSVDYAMHEYEQGYNRIQSPALAEAANGDLLLFAEGRSNPRSAVERIAQQTMPAGDTDIILRRSSSQGASWDEQISVVAGEGSGETFGFPQAVTTASGEIILHYSRLPGHVEDESYAFDASQQRVYQVISADDGRTWSAPTEITDYLQSDVGYLRSGPGHGIELTSDAFKNRLVMPVVHDGKQVRVALSDDGGQSWRLSDPVAGNNRSSGSVVELDDSRLMMVLGHGNTSPRNRLVSYSDDGGETWAVPVDISATVNTGDFGHLTDGVLVKAADGTISVVTPVNRESDSDTYGGPQYGVTPTLFSSTDGGQSFGSGVPLFDGLTYHGYAAPVGAMDAVALQDGTVIVVGEGGVESPREGIVVYRK